MADLKELETQWNAPEHRHPAFADQPHPINFNLGRIEGGEWNSSVPCTCTLGIRFSFYPDMTPEIARDIVAARVRHGGAAESGADRAAALAGPVRAGLRVRPGRARHAGAGRHA